MMTEILMVAAICTSTFNSLSTEQLTACNQAISVEADAQDLAVPIAYRGGREAELKYAAGVEFLRRLGSVNKDLKRSICSQHPEFPDAACKGFRSASPAKQVPGGKITSGPYAGCDADPSFTFPIYYCNGHEVKSY